MSANSTADFSRKIWIAPRKEKGCFPFIFHSKPIVKKYGDDPTPHVYSLAHDEWQPVLWVREYRQKRYRNGDRRRS